MDVLSAMRTFVAIVDKGSLTAAADALDRSQPAVVRSLAALESHLGVRLAHRTTRRMTLTPEGSDYLARCRQILADVDEAEQALRQSDRVLRGRLRVTAPVQFGQRHIAPLITRFLRDHAEVSVDLLLLDRNVDLVEERIDLALRIGVLPDSGFVAATVGQLRRVVCASAALLERCGIPQHPGELAHMPCVQMSGLARSGHWTFRDGRRDLPVKVSGPLSCNQIAGAVNACVEGVGFGQFLSYQVQDELACGALRRVLEGYEVTDIPVNLVSTSARFATSRQQALARFLRRELRERVFLNDC